jgi:predicted PurR-regulated permease PerM
MFAILMVFFVWATFLLLPFFEPVFVGSVLAIVFYPVFKRLLEVIGSRRLASFGTILVMLTIFFGITSVFLSSLGSAATEIGNNADENISRLMDRYVSVTGDRALLEKYTWGKLSEKEIAKQLQDLVAGNQGVLIKFVGGLVGAVGDIVPTLIVIFYLIFYVYVDEESILEVIHNIIPLDPSNTASFINEISNNVRGIVIGQGFTSIVSGLSGGLGLWLFGFNGAAFWGFVMMFCAFLPMVGTNLIWIPAGIIALVFGDYFSGGGIIIWGFTVQTYVDNIFTPQVIGRYMRCHPVFVLLGVFGGVVSYGLIGVFLGPLVLVTLMTCFTYYQKQWLEIEEEDEVEGDELEAEGTEESEAEDEDDEE